MSTMDMQLEFPMVGTDQWPVPDETYVWIRAALGHLLEAPDPEKKKERRLRRNHTKTPGAVRPADFPSPPEGWLPAREENEFIRRMLAQHQECLVLTGVLPANRNELFARMAALVDEGDLELAWLFKACRPQSNKHMDRANWSRKWWERLCRLLASYRGITKPWEDGEAFSTSLFIQFFKDIDDDWVGCGIEEKPELLGVYGQAWLGMNYAYGLHGAEKNTARALPLLRQSAKAGSLAAMMGLWDQLRSKTSSGEAIHEAEYWLAEAVASGDPRIRLNHALHVLEFRKEEAGNVLRYYARQSLDDAWSGDGDGQVMQGLWHEFKARLDGKTVSQHCAEAAQWFFMAGMNRYSRSWVRHIAEAGALRCKVMDNGASKEGVRRARKYFATPQPWRVPVQVLERQIVIEPLPGRLFCPEMHQRHDDYAADE